MAPYYQDTSHGMSAFIEMFYEYPILIFLLVAVVGAAVFVVSRRKNRLNNHF